jgi:hypothetical protein
MSKKLTKTFIKHYNTCFKQWKDLLMDLNFFENDIFCQICNINLNIIVWKKFKFKKKNSFEKKFKKIQRIFPKK